MNPSPGSWVFRENSLDAIRLLAASQVALVHVIVYLDNFGGSSLPHRLLTLFPGVPIFFFVSGYLISRSFERAPSIKQYAVNRALRLYPALVICVAINLLMVGLTGYFAVAQASIIDVAGLFLAKASVLQFFNPDFMRAFGDGVLNGSLWTIAVELQFYFAYPAICLVFFRTRLPSTFWLATLTVFFLLVHIVFVSWRGAFQENFLWKLFGVSFAPWFYMFLLGVLAQRQFARISLVLRHVPATVILTGYVLIAYGLTELGHQTGNTVSPLIMMLLVVLIMRIAYCAPSGTDKLLRGNDYSYGIYLWHMPIVNQLLYLGYDDAAAAVPAALAATMAVAAASWHLVEKPALGMKSFSIYLRSKSRRPVVDATNLP